MGEAVKDKREEVIQGWYMDDDTQYDQRLPHHKEPKEFISLDKLAELGVLSWRLDADNYETDEDLKKIRDSRGYSYMDFCEVCPEKLPNYEDKVKSFFEEHLHTDEEIRYCVAGSGYFDVRDRDEAWIRVWVKKGGMIVLPAGIYHRFTVDSDNYIKAMRLFVGEPVWTPYNRPHDHLPARKEYIDNFSLPTVLLSDMKPTNHDSAWLQNFEVLMIVTNESQRDLTLSSDIHRVLCGGWLAKLRNHGLSGVMSALLPGYDCFHRIVSLAYPSGVVVLSETTAGFCLRLLQLRWFYFQRRISGEFLSANPDPDPI
ncbi:unnamed protein product [Cochlearia groenlandica]